MKDHQEIQPPRPRVLLVEDDAGNAMVLTQILELEFDVTLAVTGADALRCAAAERFDVFVIDLNLPDISGVELLAGLQGPGNPSPLPAVAISATPPRPGERGLLPAGFSAFMLKPPSRLSELNDLVRQVLQPTPGDPQVRLSFSTE